MCNIFDDLFDGAFDLNGDAKTTMDEAFLAMQCMEEAEQTKAGDGADG
ncbi:MAG TPA: hypothetical protein IAB20_05360 [Candidatus Pullichristensenella excrementipullorum]|nr:hypothetical protein [Candidatus Pullichristensenella excrementipullorum]